MALQSPIDLMGLHSADGYWKLLMLQYDERTETLYTEVAGYANKEMRDKGLDQNVVVRQERIPFDASIPENVAAFDAVKALLYVGLKGQEFFASATDVIDDDDDDDDEDDS